MPSTAASAANVGKHSDNAALGPRIRDEDAGATGQPAHRLAGATASTVAQLGDSPLQCKQVDSPMEANPIVVVGCAAKGRRIHDVFFANHRSLSVLEHGCCRCG